MRNMRNLDLDNLKKEDLVELPVLINAFKQYLQAVLGYDESEAEIAATDLENPYETPYIMQDYLGEIEIDGVPYEVRYFYSDFCACGLFYLASEVPFEFCMLFDQRFLQDQTVGAYMNAPKKFVL